MSVNNLPEHLSWLLESKSFIPPTRSFTRTIVEGQAVLKPNGEASPAGFSTSASQSEMSKERFDGASLDMEEHGSCKPINKSNMGRMRITPSPRRAARLISPNFSDSNSNQHAACQLTATAPQLQVTTNEHSKSCQKPQSIPKSAPNSLKNVNAESPDVLDLTMDDESDLECTGGSQLINPQTIGSLVDKSATAGKKRKSEEFESDLKPRPSIPNSKRQLSWGHGFDVIEDDIEDPPPPYSTALPAPQGTQSGQYDPLSCNLSKLAEQTKHDSSSLRGFQDSISSSEEIPRPSQVKVSALQYAGAEQRISPRPLPSQKDGYSELNVVDRRTSQSIGTLNELEDRDVAIRSPKGRDIFTNTTFKEECGNAAQMQTGGLKISANNRPAQPHQDSSVNALSQCASSSNQPSDEQNGKSKTAQQSALERHSLTRMLLEWPFSILERKLQNVIAKFDQSLDEFVVATSEDSSDVILLKSTLDKNRVEKNAMEQLIKAVPSYKTLKERHTTLSEAFKDVVRQGIDEQRQDVVAELKKVTKALRQQEDQLLLLIKDANLHVDEKYNLLSNLNDFHHSAVLSTPNLPQSPTPAQLSHIDSRPSITRPVTQSQAPFPTAQRSVDPAQLYQHHGSFQSSRTNKVEDRGSHAQEAKHHSKYDSVLRGSPQRENIHDLRGDYENHLSTPNTLNLRELPESDESFDDVDENIFSTIMGTPPEQLLDEDDFDLRDDDDLLEITNEILPSPPKPRTVFAETSGNLVPAPLSRQVLKPSPKSKGTSSSISTHEGLQHPWSTDVKDVMLNTFHLTGFRSNQLEAINATLAGQHVFVLMPTGGGKSLCYQLPAVVQSGKTRGVTIVISPLLSLMEDQISHLHKLGIRAALINGEISAAEKSEVMNDLRNPNFNSHLRILYVTPEMVTKNQGLLSAFRNLHSHGKLARFVIDEAHCVSQWGHDFRPDYKMLGEIIQEFEGIPIMALTATATETVKADVMHNLNIEGCPVLSQSFNRPNLTYEILPKKNQQEVFNGIVRIINMRYSNKSGIIYCLSRKKCEDIADQLRGANIKAHHYHAHMSSHEKKDIQQKWQAGQIDVIVATIAFGMGIDKPDVRFVIHHSIPKSLEGYYQETGRAGRDGMRSGCYLYYGFQDFNILRGMIDKGDGSKEQKDRQIHMLRNVVQFCENKSDCRRAQVLAYFNEAFRKEDCNGGCDNCNSTSEFENRDLTDYAIAALKIVKQLWKSKVTMLHCVDVFRGAKTKKLTDKDHHTLAEYGSGAALNRNDAERIFNRLISEGALAQHNITRNKFTHSYIKPGKNYKGFERGNKRVNIQVRVSPTRPNRQLNETQQRRRQKQHNPAREHTEFPLSTNISSPIRRPENKSLLRYQYEPNDSKRAPKGNIGQENSNIYRNYDQSDSESIDEEAFEPVRPAVQRKGIRVQLLGPPITTDEKMSNLNEIHRHCVDDFVGRAKNLCQKILFERSLRQVPFTDTMLREMAISFPRSKEEMLAIPGIDPEKVELYGKRFLDLIKIVSENYNSIVRDGEDRPMDPNHQTVVDLVSDDDIGEEGTDEEIDGDNGSDFEASEGEQSSYFVRQDEFKTPDPIRRPRSPLRKAPAASASRLRAVPRSSRGATKAGRRQSWNGNYRATSKPGNGRGAHKSTATSRGRRSRAKNTSRGSSSSLTTAHLAIETPSNSLSRATGGIGMMPT